MTLLSWLLAASIAVNLVLVLIAAGCMRTLCEGARAGAWIIEAMEHIARLDEEARRVDANRQRMIREAGFAPGVSFNAVWAACLSAYREKHYGKA